MGVRRISMQNVSICARAQLHRFNIHFDGDLCWTVLCNYLSDNLQADTNTYTTAGKYEF